ncbi:MAG: hypothetical protein QF473_17290 [Planctomycetota bacterium]|jgi:uncharacterized membrane protein YjfL (UPF0719 family)|nr:hypothetical protein [Planctomycetota bacterium]
MSRIERTEAILIAMCVPAVGVSAAYIPQQIRLDNFVLTLAVLLLIQTLVRDIYLIRQLKHQPKRVELEPMRCICLESVIGVTGVIIGLTLLLTRSNHVLYVSPISWSIAAFIVMAIGFLIKDLILEMGPWRIRRDRDHLNIVFAWRPNHPS